MAGHSYFDEMLERNLVLHMELNTARMQLAQLRGLVECLAHYRVPVPGRCSWCQSPWNADDAHDWCCPVTDARAALGRPVGGTADAAK